MDIFFSFSYWLFLPQFWIIIGILFIVLEMLNGSLIFFLPVGIGALLNALILYIQENHMLNNESLFHYEIISVWHHSLISLALFSVIASYSLRHLTVKKNQKDVNNY